MKQNILTIIFIVFLLGTGYVWYQYARSVSAPESLDAAADVSGTLDRVRRLKTLQLETSVFQDPALKILKPLPRKDRPSVIPGRENPFVPF